MKPINVVTAAQLDKNFETTEKALSLAKLKKSLSEEQVNIAKTFIDFCSRYLSDAKHFRQQGNYVNALRAVNYAHAWLDAAAILGLLDVQGQSDLFTTD